LENTNSFYAIAAVYIALTEATGELTGKPVQHRANEVLGDLLPMLPEAKAPQTSAPI